MANPSRNDEGLKNPLLLEITSLKSALARYQHAADTANLHLQRQAFDSSTLSARNVALEQDNQLLRAEIELLRSIPDSTPHPATLQVSELSLALRHVSDKLKLSEQSLFEANENLILASKAKARISYELEGAEQMVKHSREEVEGWKERIRLLEAEVKGKEEERRIMEVCVKEYADLVRSLEGRHSTTSTALPGTFPITSEDNIHSKESSLNSGSSGARSHSRAGSAASTTSPAQRRSLSQRPIDSLNEGRIGLQRLLGEFHSQTERLETEIARLHGEVELMEMRLDARERMSLDEQKEVSRLKNELAAKGREDKSASMMVEKYMSFSQQSTNLLQTALQTQKKRHATTIATYDAQIEALKHEVEREMASSNKLRDTLDDLTLEIARESAGRRREVALRLSLVERERKLGILLEKWINGMERGKDSDSERGRTRAIESARSILGLIRGGDIDWEEGEKSRIEIAIQEVEVLQEELERETERRMELERMLIRDQTLETSDVVSNLSRSGTDDIASKSTSDSQSREESPDSEGDVNADEEEEEKASQPASDHPISSQHNIAEAPSGTPTAGSEIDAEGNEEMEMDPEVKAILEGLHIASTRYKSLQSSLDDCHNALTSLRSSFSSSDLSGNYLSSVIDRLDDYCEDARVELEILVADEARISQGYETLISLSPAHGVGHDELRPKIDAFIQGTEPSIAKAQTIFAEKIDNLMHDIAIIKRELHGGMNASSDSLTSSGMGFPRKEGNEEDNSPANSFTWKNLTSSLVPRTTTPAPRTVSTFGSLMAASRPRQSSNASLPPTESDSHPLNYLGLRIAMPRSPGNQGLLNIHSPFPFTSRLMDKSSPGVTGEPKSAPLSRVGSGWLKGGIMRSRTISSIHLPGLAGNMGITPMTSKSESQVEEGVQEARRSSVPAVGADTQSEDEVE